MTDQMWSWALTGAGLTCFWLAGRHVWWAWFVGLAAQALWLGYSLVTQQWGFLAGVVAYSIVYSKNAARWTAEHRAATRGTTSPDETTAESLSRQSMESFAWSREGCRCGHTRKHHPENGPCYYDAPDCACTRFTVADTEVEVP